SADAVVSGSNVSMFTDCITAMAGEGEQNIAIPVKEFTLSNITVTSVAAMLGGLAASIFVPALLIIVGIVIWAVRRKR
ncbi:MAG: copper ABC transporter permease, partial [Roseburia sp.]|nr:copper ABC transporter permease [Roseburia sp.]